MLVPTYLPLRRILHDIWIRFVDRHLQVISQSINMTRRKYRSVLFAPIELEQCIRVKAFHFVITELLHITRIV